jgi:hypothetical protein
MAGDGATGVDPKNVARARSNRECNGVDGWSEASGIEERGKELSKGTKAEY